MTVERPSGDLGKKLREARERKGVSLRQIANTTKIAVAVLDGLERNDISKLPGGIFGRAFVRSFATEVGLDPEASIKEFIAQFRDDSVAAGHPLSEQIEDNEALESKRRRARTLLGAMTLIAAAAGAIAYAYFGFGGAVGGLKRPVASAQPAPAPAPGQPTATTVGLALQDVSSTGSPSPQAVSDNASPVPAGTTERPATDASLGDRLTITLAVTRPCWVSATVDGQKQMERVLKPGDAPSLDIGNELALTVGDAGALTMRINGVEAKALGKAGEVVTARVNLTNVKTYLPGQ